MWDHFGGEIVHDASSAPKNLLSARLMLCASMLHSLFFEMSARQLVNHSSDIKGNAEGGGGCNAGGGVCSAQNSGKEKEGYVRYTCRTSCDKTVSGACGALPVKLILIPMSV